MPSGKRWGTCRPVRRSRARTETRCFRWRKLLSRVCDDLGVGRGDLTDEQWARLEPLLPVGKKPGRPRVWPRRRLIDGIRWRTRTGAPWRDLPERFGPWDRVYDPSSGTTHLRRGTGVHTARMSFSVVTVSI
nr:transposase [Streptomyces tsukubensis NRRL18488]